MQRSQKSSRVNLQKSDVQPKPFDRLWAGASGSKRNLQQQQMRTRLEASEEMSRESGVPAVAADEDTVEARFRPRSNLLNPLRV